MYIFAHRGDSHLLPENTLSAIQSGCSSGAEGVEFDVQITKDGNLVIFHDRDGTRILRDPRGMADYSLAEVKELDAGGWKGTSEKIPTLDEILLSTSCSMIVEVKPQWRKIEENFTLEQKILDTLDNHGTNLGKGYISVRTVESIEYIRDHSNYPVGMMQKKRTVEEFQEIAESYSVEFAQIRWKQYSEPQIQDLKRISKVVAFYADTPSEWDTLSSYHIYGVLTNKPRQMIAYLDKYGMNSDIDG